MNSSLTLPRPSRSLGSARTRTILVTAALAVVIGAVAFIVDQPTTDGGLTSVTLSGDTSGAVPRVGEAAPDFTVTTTDGKAVRLSDYRGQPVWLTFGASWCNDCRSEATDLQATYAKLHPEGLVVLQISIEEDSQAVRDYAGRAGLTWTMAADPDTTIASRYHVLGIPTHYFLDRDGAIRVIRVGGLPPLDMEQLARSVMG